MSRPANRKRINTISVRFSQSEDGLWMIDVLTRREPGNLRQLLPWSLGLSGDEPRPAEWDGLLDHVTLLLVAALTEIMGPFPEDLPERRRTL